MFKTKINKIITLSGAVVVLMFALTLIIASTTDNNSVTENTPSTETTEPVSESVTTTELPITTTPPRVPTVTGSSQGNADTEPAVIEITLAPVEIPSEDFIAIIEEYGIDIVVTEPVTQTAPAEQRQPNETTYINGRKHTWNPVLGWVKSSGDSGVIVMDVESDGEMYEGGW